MLAPMVSSHPKHTHVRIRLITKAKINAVAAARRWTHVECVDAMADEFMERNGIHLPERADSERNAVGPDASITPAVNGASSSSVATMPCKASSRFRASRAVR